MSSRRSSLAALRWSFLAGVAAAALSASSLVAWHFGFAPQLGRPLFWHAYAPTAVLRWAWDWWRDPAWRGEFLSALTDVAVVALVPVGIVRLLELQGRLPAWAGKAETGLGTPRDLVRTGRVAPHGEGVVLGSDGRRLYREVTKAHVLGIGSTESGKTSGIAIPTLLTYRGSVLAYDPKGEMAIVTGRLRETIGPVFVLDPTSRASCRYNPLLEIRFDPDAPDGGDLLIADCQAMAEVLARSGTRDGSRPSFWNDAASHLLTALIAHVRAGEVPTLAHLWKLIMDFDAEVYPAATHPHAARVLAAHRADDDKLRRSINRTVSVGLRVLADPVLQRVSSGADFRASDLQAGERPATVFLTVKPSHATRLQPFTRLVLQSVAFALLDRERRTADGREKRHQLLWLLDEFPQLGEMDVIRTSLPICRSYGIRALLLAQSVKQIEDAYGARQNVTGVCGTWCLIPGLDEASLDTFRRLAGDHKVVRETRQRPVGFGGRASVSEGEVSEPVLTNATMIERAKDEVLVFTAGCRPTYLRKAPYFGRPEFRGLYDDREGELLVAPRGAADGDGPALPDEPRERVLSIPLAAGLYERLEKAAAGESLASYLGDVLVDILGEDEAERPGRPA